MSTRIIIPLIFAAASAAQAADDPTRAFLETHCIKCHSGAKPKGDLRLDNLTASLDDKATRERWHDVLDKIESGEMPPKSKPRPPKESASAVTDWITAQLTAASAKLRASEGRVVLRRLNRAEYENTVRDLLAVELPLKDMLPLDTSASGFDNVGDALHTSSFLMEKYLDAAELTLNEAVANKLQPPSTTKRSTLKESHQVKSTQEKVFRHRDDGSVVMFTSSKWQAATLSPFYPSERGRYRFRISASAVQSAGKPVTFHVWSGGGGMGGPRGHLVGYFDAPAGKPRVIEFINHMEPKTSISILPYGLASSQTVNKLGADAWMEPGLAIDWIEVEGPLNETWPPESHRRIFGDLKQAPAPSYNQSKRVEVVSDDPANDAHRILTTFARRAFRRPVSDEEMRPFAALVEKRMAEKSTFEQAMRAALGAIMTSPEFLFLREQAGKLSDLALASRLSYFLWSSMPDEELLSLAEQGKLGDAKTLRAQVERMVADPKAAALTENFTGQWLGLRELDATDPSHLLYPEYDDMLKASMLRETQLFFTEVLRNDLSVTNFIASDFSMLNGRLARHYGIDGVEGWDFKKTPLPPGSHRGGVLTMASVLKVTANGTTTSPILRGAWVLDRILGTPPSPPPPDVPSLEPDIRGATTMREQLAKHRQIESCATCHVKIDPPGFALENYDVIGGWRDHYRSRGVRSKVVNGRTLPYGDGHKVDPSDVMPDGRKFASVDEFKQLLLADKETFARALTTKLVTYATGATPDLADKAQVATIVSQAGAKGLGFKTLIHEIVQSDLFQNK